MKVYGTGYIIRNKLTKKGIKPFTGSLITIYGSKKTAKKECAFLGKELFEVIPVEIVGPDECKMKGDISNETFSL